MFMQLQLNHAWFKNQWEPTAEQREDCASADGVELGVFFSLMLLPVMLLDPDSVLVISELHMTLQTLTIRC